MQSLYTLVVIKYRKTPKIFLPAYRSFYFFLGHPFGILCATCFKEHFGALFTQIWPRHRARIRVFEDKTEKNKKKLIRGGGGYVPVLFMSSKLIQFYRNPRLKTVHNFYGWKNKHLGRFKIKKLLFGAFFFMHFVQTVSEGGYI